MNKRKLTGGLAAAGLALALSTSGVAAAADAPAAPPAAAAGQRDWRGGPETMRQRFQERRAEHARVLHDALALRPDQEAAWQAFQAAMAPPERGARGERGDRGARGEALTTPQRLDRMLARMNERQAAFQKRAAAIKKFYAVLNPTQQRTFDALAMAGHHRFAMRRGHGFEGFGMPRGPM